jgi:chromosome segregation ATPase
MKTYENTLGSGIQNGGWRKKKRWNHFKKQIHWSAVARHDADELRAVLTSEILAINTLLTMQEWTCLKETRSEHQSHAEQLRKLISTTENASREITQFLVDAKAISERLEQLIKEQKMTSEQQIKMLSSMEDRSEQSWSLLQRLARWQESCSASLKEAMENAGTQLVQFIDMKSYLEEWMQKLVQFCKDIIEMVQRNTQLLLSLHSMLARIEAMLPQARIDLPILKLENPFGITVALPFQICDSWEVCYRQISFQ